MNPTTHPHAAPARFAGWTCPVCQQALRQAEIIVECTTCGAPHHDACWNSTRACRSYECRSTASAPVGARAPADFVIRPSELKDVRIEEVAGRALDGAPAVRIARFVERRTSRMAAWAFGLGIAGVFLAGVPGIFAALFGGIALGSILNDRGLKGTWMAVTGILIGLTSMVAWIVLAIFVFWKPTERIVPSTVEFASVPDLERASAEIKTMLKANVRITGTSRSVLGGRKEWLGSGVIYRSEGGEVIILSNRHVVDGDFAEGHAGTELPEVDLKVTFANGETVPAKVDWVAPGDVDLSLVRAATPIGGVSIPPSPTGTSPQIGETVIAVGNPEGLGWSYTQGVVSGLRSSTSTAGDILYIQTQTPLNPGNSGGGLYTSKGELVGINTWTQDKRISEGLNFAISMETADRLLRADGKARSK